MTDQVRVGVGCFVFDESGNMLLMERAGAHGAGTWSIPGGHQEWFETPEQTAAREVLEETGIVIDPLAVISLGYTNDIMVDDHRHYITLFMACMLPVGEIPQNMEPEKCTNIEWCNGTPDDRKIFISLQNFLDKQPDPYGLYQSLMTQAKAA